MKVYEQAILSPAHERILERVRPGSSVLEIGCATGHMTRALTERLGCHVTAVELDAAQAERAAPYARKMIVGDIGLPKTWDEAGGPYDHVLFADVLEHLADPWTALRRAGDVLRENGSVLASIPNVAYYKIRLALLRGRFDYADYGIMDDSHLRFFTAASIGRLFGDTGYEIEEIVPIYNQRVIRRIDVWLAYPFAFQFVVAAVLEPPSCL